jgi:nucleoside 2-deoxyribosyltransferase
MAEQSKCPVCSEKATLAEPYRGGSYKLNCIRCGLFEIGDIAAQEITAWSKRQCANLSGWIREHQNCKILSPDLKTLASLRTPTVGEKAERLLTFLANEFPKPGEKIASNVIFSIEGLDVSLVDQPKVFVESQKLVSVSWSLDLHELGFLIYEYLVAEKNFVSQIEGSNLKITPRGWSQIDSLRQGNSQSKIGFIAMWFDKSVDPAHAAIEAGIRTSGYEPLRIDRKEHNNKIDDEIVAGIRRSKFLVADFTGHRGGVYFETGFATGLGLQVIWLCRQDELEKTHFDTRQYNFIVWEAGKLDELSKALQIRIEATIGHGPLAEKA